MPLLVSLAAIADADPPREVTDAGVAEAVDHAVEWLRAQQNPSRHWESTGEATESRYWAGDTALALLSLLYAGQSPNQSEISGGLEWLAAQKPTGTYVVSLRAQALSLAPGPRFRTVLRNDLRWLVDAAAPRAAPNAGAYGYLASDSDNGWWDNSNSQYGALGVWMATEAGVEFSGGRQYWELIRDYWLRQQESDGGWSYRKGSASTGSMTVAGIATLYVVLDRLQTGNLKDSQPVSRALDSGLDWLGQEFTPGNPRGDSRWKYYYLYGVERAARASGRKYFRSRDWFREAAADLLRSQQSNGCWPGTGGEMSELRNTAFATLFLCHGRAPLVFNKLEVGRDWDLYPRDVAGMTWYAQNVLERLLNWQIVPMEGPLDDLLEAPVLYWSGREGFDFSPAQVQKLREYCERGGLLFGMAVDGSQDFVTRFRGLAQQAFPEHAVRPLPPDHPLFSGSVQFPIANPPLMLEVHNGIRTLMLLCTHDVADSWNRFRARGNRERDFELGVNVYLYATDKGQKRSRLTSSTIPQRAVASERTIRVGRVRHDGAWSIEPYGWTRLARYLLNETASTVLVTSGVRLDTPGLNDEFDVLHLTGTEALRLSDAEQQGLRRFLTGGGVLLADAAGGSREFHASFEEILRRILKQEPEWLPEDVALLTGAGIPGAVDLSGAGYRRAARTGGAPLRDRPALRAFLLGQRYAVIYSPLDLSVGLLGTDVYDCRGYEPETSLRILRNCLLYAMLSKADQSRLSTGR